MPINQVVGNESIKKVCRPGEQLPKLLQPEKGSSYMAKASTFCRCPEDPEGCRQSLIQAWREGSIGKYCIMGGLQANLHQCRQVLLEGLYDKISPRKGSGEKATATGGQKNGLHEACKAVVLLGYPLEIKVVPEVFHEAYYNLVRTIIHRFGIKDDSQPSADDVSQQVFTNLHEQFHKGASVQAPLAAYIIRVTGEAFFVQTLRQEKPAFEFELVQFGEQVRISTRSLGDDSPYKNCLARLELFEGDLCRCSQIILIDKGEGECVLEPEEARGVRPQQENLAMKLVPIVTLDQLASAGSDAYMPILGKLLRHEEPKIRCATVEVIARICGPQAQSLIKALADDEDETVRQTVKKALNQFPQP